MFLFIDTPQGFECFTITVPLFLGRDLRKEPKTILNDYLGWHRQSKGKWFLGLHFLSGRLTKDKKNITIVKNLKKNNPGEEIIILL